MEAGDKANAAMNFIRNAMKAKSPKARAEHVSQAQQAIRSISPSKHSELVNALQAMRAGIDPRRYTVGHRANSVNPMTGKPEFGCFYGDPGECFVPGIGGPPPWIEQIPALPPWLYPGITGYGQGDIIAPGRLELGGPIGDVGGTGGGGGGGDASIIDFLRDPLCVGVLAESSPCCKRNGPQVKPNFGVAPSQPVLDGMTPNELETTANVYESFANFVDVASTFGGAAAALKAARVIGALGKYGEVAIEIEDCFIENPELQGPAEHLRNIASAYRRERSNRGGTTCSETELG
ncbi:MAG: hypothetical protein SFV19_06555 [Rhodospirillaceae bacterium]|nr:hypothetical protein [Rhodospirillaceae bacterium]